VESPTPAAVGVRALRPRVRCDCAVTSAVRGGGSRCRGIPTVLKPQRLRPNWTDLNRQPRLRFPFATNSSL
jgi:hypothetical protein